MSKLNGEKDELQKYVACKLELYSKTLDTTPTKAALANLRRGILHKPGEMPSLWHEIFSGMPESLFVSTCDEPLHAEWAIYTALTFFAMHQQGQTTSVNVKGISFGEAMSNLYTDYKELLRIEKRFAACATSSDVIELSRHMASIIQLLKASGNKLDYVRLALDIYDFSWGNNSRSRVLLKWGTDFYKKIRNPEIEFNNQ